MEEVILPQPGEIMKVVQLYLDRPEGRIPYFICGPENKLHGDILEEILRKSGIEEFKTSNAGDDKNPIMLPAKKGRGYEVVGMGSCQNVGKFYSLYDESIDYNLKINKSHLDDIINRHPELKGRLEIAEED